MRVWHLGAWGYMFGYVLTATFGFGALSFEAMCRNLIQKSWSYNPNMFGWKKDPNKAPRFLQFSVLVSAADGRSPHTVDLSGTVIKRSLTNLLFGNVGSLYLNFSTATRSCQTYEYK